METNIHAIGDNDFSISLKDQGTCTVALIKIGEASVTLYFHDNKIDKAIHDIDTAIRAFLDNRK